MTTHASEPSPLVYARIAGVFYLLESLTAVFGQMFVLGELVVSGNSAATAANILGHETMFRLGFASSLVAVAFHIAWALLFFKLLKPVDRNISLNAYLVFFGIWCTLVGYLIFRSTFLPRIIGLLMVVAGVGYLTLLWPPLVKYLYPINLAVAAPGELSLLVWLLLKGVNASKWNQEAAERQNVRTKLA
jgi:Domain of unknown function (DUF4386)